MPQIHFSIEDVETVRKALRAQLIKAEHDKDFGEIHELAYTLRKLNNACPIGAEQSFAPAPDNPGAEPKR